MIEMRAIKRTVARLNRARHFPLIPQIEMG